MLKRIAPLLLAFLASCSISSQSGDVSALTGDTDYDSTDKLRFEIEQTSDPMTFRGDRGAVDVSFRVIITNRSEGPITIKRLSLQSMGGGSYRLQTSSRKFDKTIDRMGKESFKYWAQAVATDLDANTRVPLVVRTTVEALADGTRIREVFNRRVNGTVSIGITGNDQ